MTDTATNVVSLPTFDSTDAQRAHNEAAQEAIREAYQPENIVKAGRAFGRSQARKVLRATFKGFTADEVVAHCLSL